MLRQRARQESWECKQDRLRWKRRGGDRARPECLLSSLWSAEDVCAAALSPPARRCLALRRLHGCHLQGSLVPKGSGGKFLKVCCSLASPVSSYLNHLLCLAMLILFLWCYVCHLHYLFWLCVGVIIYLFFFLFRPWTQDITKFIDKVAIILIVISCYCF